MKFSPKVNQSRIVSIFPRPSLDSKATMVCLGIAIRTTDYDATIKAWVIGILYPGIGLALLIGARSVAFGTPPEPQPTDAPPEPPADSSASS